MIFTLIMLVVSLIGFACSCTFNCKDPDVNFIFITFFMILAICFIGVLIIAPIDPIETRNVVSKMRTEPQNFSIQDASEMNIKLAKIDRWKDTIFTFYKGFDTTPLDLNNFVKI